jgi:phosphoserine phosphatase
MTEERVNLIVQGEDVATADLKALHALVSARAIERVAENAFRITGADAGRREAVAAHCATARLDWGFVSPGRSLAGFGLLAMDMDSTLISIECIDEIADFAGRKSEVAAITASAMRGEIDWPTSLRQRVSALTGLEESALERVYAERLRFNPGAEKLVAAARAQGLKTLLVSGGFTYFTDRVRDRLRLDYAYSNVLDITGGKLAGTASGPLVDAAGKAAHLERIAAEMGIAKDRILAIGDGANDLPMMAAAGTSIAYHAKPVVKAQATYALDYVGLEGCRSCGRSHQVARSFGRWATTCGFFARNSLRKRVASDSYMGRPVVRLGLRRVRG